MQAQNKSLKTTPLEKRTSNGL